jgi:hypothetical protein
MNHVFDCRPLTSTLSQKLQSGSNTGSGASGVAHGLKIGREILGRRVAYNALYAQD